MASFEPVSASDADSEYRVIEAALLETARGRWFLAEHSRRSRRFETIELEDALTRLHTSMREPPALLGRLEAELTTIEGMLAEARQDLLARTRPGQSDGAPTLAALLDAAERLHEMVWSLQAHDIDPAACETISRQMAAIFALTARQAQESQRAVKLAGALDGIAERVSAVLRSVVYEAAGNDLDGSLAVDDVAA